MMDIVDVELEPWEFKIGNLRKVLVNFSGGCTTQPEWYFRNDVINKNELNVSLIIKKASGIKNIKANVRVLWSFNNGGRFNRKRKFGSDSREIVIYNEKNS